MMDFLTVHNLNGLLIGLCTFVIIGLFHPLVIKGEFYLGLKARWLFLIAGIAFTIFSVTVKCSTASILLGVAAFSCFWSVLEVHEQRKRVERGWFPENPKRKPKS